MKLKVLRVLLCATALLTTFTATAYAQSSEKWDRFTYNYEFESGADYDEELGTPTTTDIMGRNEELENVRRDKNVALAPPPYGFFSGEFDTEQTNPYMTVKDTNYIRETTATNSLPTYDTTSTGVNGASSNNGYLPSTSLTSSDNNSGYYQKEINTKPLEYSNGSIGTLKIPEIDLNIKIYEGETMDNMKKGGAHFEFTSAWDGNVGICAHNSGSYGYFEDLKKLDVGDKITYKTRYGERTYKVTSTDVIYDTDYSYLTYSSENMLTLITCQRGESEKRYVVVAKEV